MADVEDAAKLAPRAYQEEIFDQARHENVIAALETGSGKTFIAALLIKWIMAQPSQAGKKTFFLVPKVPLVDQQRDFLAEQTPLTVRGYKGAMGLDEWDRARWGTELAQADCLVMTAQVFKNILTHGYWSMDRTSLLVFDECHHARGHHPYNVIMRDHYVPCSEKPKVFGMSASPIWNTKNPKASLEMLQSNLFSKVIMVREHVQVLDQHTKKPVECLLRFSNSPRGGYSSYYQPSLWEQLGSSELVNDPRLSIRSLHGRYQVTFDALGPAGADYFLLTHTSNTLEAHTRRVVKLPAPASPDAYKADVHRSLLESQVINDDSESVTRLDKLDLALSRFRKRFISDVRSLPSEWLSPKLQAAINVLVEHRSETFHGIIFVQQRQVVMALSWILSRVAETKDWVRCGELTGHGEYSTDGERVVGMNTNTQQEVVESFRSGKLNLLIATSVAEEGLDFPACKLVIRFDSLSHMVGYLQSRGRARQQDSKYVILVEENSVEEIDRYESFRQAEPYLKTVYQSMAMPDLSTPESSNDEELEDDDPLDLASRESYVIPTTGAMLTYSSAISLLNHLCSSIPRDAYTPPLQPKYSGGFEASVQLPRALPLPSEKLLFHGLRKRTKKEAKRAVAFLAVRALHVLGVFDDHLLPLTSRKGAGIEDADGRPIKKVSDVAVTMDVLVASPWKAGPPWYLHFVCSKGHICAGIICGTSLPEVDLIVQNTHVKVESRASPLSLNVSPTRLRLLEKFTKMGIWWCVTGSPVNSPLACFLVPVSPHGLIDWELMEKAVVDERGTYDWSGVTNDDEGKVMLMNDRRSGRPLRFERFRRDLSLTSKPAVGDVANGDGIEGFNSYAEYFAYRYPLHYKSAEDMDIIQPPAGRVVEVSPIPRTPFSSYNFLASGSYEYADDAGPHMASNFLLPESYCRRVALHMDIIRAFQVFGPVCQRICDIFRARVARMFLKFPEIPDDLLLEALTLPCAKAGFNNQRLETLGDSVLKLSVVVYIFNNFPNKHEGQLDALKTNSVSNRLLLSRAKEVHLEQFLTCEPRKMRTWQFTLPSTADSDRCEVDSEVVALVRRSFPRRSLQDCMEASLGAAYVAGGIDLALRTGTALNLCFGGPSPWPERYQASEEVPAATLFGKLQEDLRYTFRNGNLLVEAVKHPSFNAQEGGSCYQRLEFMGDAVIELVVTTYLYNKFPRATSGEMSWARSKAVCNSTLAALAVKRLSLHRYLLANSIELSKDVEQAAATLYISSYEAITINNWRYDPPKVIADLFESIVGAIFVDTGFNYPVVELIVRRIMEDVLELLHPDMPRNPVTRLLEWVTKSGCTKAKFEKIQSSPLVRMKDSVIVMVHDHIVAGPISAANKPLAKGLVAEAAMKALSNEASEFALQKICECMRVEDEEEPSDLPERNVREKDLNIETTEGFALAGHVRLAEVEAQDKAEENEVMDEEQNDFDQQEVEQLLVVVRE